MPTIGRFDPPGLLNDFDAIPNQRVGWSKYISDVFDRAIADVEQEVGTHQCQFFNQTQSAPATLAERYVVWNAFPRTLVKQFGRSMALKMSYQTSIRDQFEFLSNTWMNQLNKPEASDSGHDLIVGQNPMDPARIRKCKLVRQANGPSVEIVAQDEWVIPTGGGYFLTPSTSALRDVLSQ